MPPALALLVLSLATAAPAPFPADALGTGVGGAAAVRTRVVIVDEVRGNQGTPEARAALREALGRHLGRRGFQVVEGAKRFSFRLQPNLLLMDVQNGTNVEVKASVVALDRKGKVAAMVEGGARVKGGVAGTPATRGSALEAQALEAAARSLVEDLAPRLLEIR